MALSTSPSIVTSGLVFSYDMNNRNKSWLGVPTTNISSGIGIGTYLNTPSDVTSSLTQTTELYKGQPVYKQVLTPVTSGGVGQLTNAGNPGIGVVTGGGGGAAARYTGHSIFFKPALGRAGLNSSTPIFTHYSNIGGWQSSGNYDDMGDGWYRAHVIFYSAGGGSDGKYWAINPAGAALNVPITIYWAAPFKEDRNDSSFVSPYTYSARSNTQAVLDLTRKNTLTASALTYNSDNTFSFNGSNQFINCGTGGALTLGNNGAFTASAWIRISALKNYSGIISKVESSRPGTYSFMCCAHNDGTLNFYNNSSWYYSNNVGITTNTWYNVAFSFNGSTMSYYVNGVAAGTSALTWPETTAHNVFVGSWYSPNTSYDFNGTIANAQLYNRGLSAAEVRQNFSALRGRYGV
jgi:hypothetical protein